MIKLTFLAVQRIVNDLFVLNRAFQQFISPAPPSLPLTPLASPPPPEINLKLPHFIKAICAGIKNLTSVPRRRSFQPLQAPVKAPLQMNHLHFLITRCKWCLEPFLGWGLGTLLLSLCGRRTWNPSATFPSRSNSPRPYLLVFSQDTIWSNFAF